LRLYRRLHEVSDSRVTSKSFGSVRLHRNNAYYGFLLHVCRLIHDNLLIDETTGDSQFRDFLRDEKQMPRMFEAFVRNFYRREQAAFLVRSESFNWRNVEATDADLPYLPGMRTDVSLESPTRKIVIDTKFSAKCLQSYFDSETIHSGNLYQLFAYLKNLQIGETRRIEGILLYPTVGKSLALHYLIHDHAIQIVTVDLKADWQDIRQRLLELPMTTTLGA
jgi:5-methylcytosine-specific restriction enzyme subunit McrC